MLKVGLVVGVVLLVVGSTRVMAGKDDRPNSPPPPNPFRQILDKLDDILNKLNNNSREGLIYSPLLMC
jgi:hypothetical protein